MTEAERARALRLSDEKRNVLWAVCRAGTSWRPSTARERELVWILIDVGCLYLTNERTLRLTRRGEEELGVQFD